MISKEQYVKCVDSIQKYDEWEHKCYELGINFWERGEVQEMIQNFIDLLSTCTNDFDECVGSNLGYFIYTDNWGKDADKYFITEEDGTEVKFRCAGDVYDYVTKEN